MELSNKEFKEFILKMVNKNKQCIQKKDCWDEILKNETIKNPELILYKAIKMDYIDIMSCKTHFENEFNQINKLQEIKISNDKRSKDSYSSVYSICKNNKPDCSKIIAKILPIWTDTFSPYGITGHPAKVEIEILKLLTEEIVIPKKSPNIVIYYSNINCKIDKQISKNIPELKYTKYFKQYFADSIIILFTEYIKGMTFKTWLIKKRTKEEIQSILFQLFYTLLILQEKYNFMHFDLHSKNVLLKKMETNTGYWIYNYKGTKYYVANKGYQLKLWDFDFSTTFKNPKIKNNKIYSEEFIKYGMYPEFNYAYDYFFLLHDLLYTYDIPESVFRLLVDDIKISSVPFKYLQNYRLIIPASATQLPTIDKILKSEFFEEIKQIPTNLKIIDTFNFP